MWKKISKLCLTFIIFLIGTCSVNAAGYTISLSSSNPTKGTTVTLYIKGTEIAGGFNVSSSDSTVASVSTSSVWVDNNTQTVSISTYKEGSSVITVTPISVSDYNGNDISLPTKTLNINVASKKNSNNKTTTNSQTKSSDATLKSLSIDNFNLDQEFKSDVLEYNIEVPADTEKVKINAVTNSGKASINGNGEIGVTEGANKLEVVVTAEDGTTKTYIINVKVKELDPITIKIGNEEYTVIRKEKDLPEIDLFEKSKINIGEEEVIGYYNEKLNIYLVGLKDSKGNSGLYVYDTKKQSYVKFNWITAGGVTLQLKDAEKKLNNFKKYNLTINNIKVNIYKLNKKDEIGLIYGTNIVTGNKGWYVYDEKEETLARYFNDEVKLYKNKVESYKNYLMIFMGVTSALIITTVIISLIKTKKRRRKFNR